MINGYFDHIYCLNLDHRTDKWAQCLQEFEKHGLTVERFPGIDGRTLPKHDILIPGELGCAMSHAAIVKDIAEKGYKRALILEDDVEFIPDLNSYFDSNAHLIPENWTMLYFGGNHINPPKPVNKAIARITKTFTTSHYALTLNVAKAIYSRIEKTNVQVDVLYTQFQPGSESYTFHPPIAWQRPCVSDIQGVFTDYTTHMKKR